MSDVLASRPQWGPDFIFFLAKEGSDPRTVAGLFTRLRRARIPISEAADASLIENLIGKGAIEEAWSFYTASHPEANRTKSRDPGFANDQGSRSSFDWQLFGDGGVSTAIERGDQGNVLAFSIIPGGSGLLARQMQLLPRGAYILRGKSANIDLPEMARPVWELSCLDGRSLGKMTLPNSTERNGAFMARFDVPAECPVQYLSLIARPYDMGARSESEIHEVLLYPAS
jgi:hypothetical protein